MPAIWSAILWMGGFFALTDSIRLTSFAREESPPTFFTLSLRVELRFKDPQDKFPPSFTSIGLDSPVICETSTYELPWVTMQSAGTLSPAKTWISWLGLKVFTLLDSIWLSSV